MFFFYIILLGIEEKKKKRNKVPITGRNGERISEFILSEFPFVLPLCFHCSSIIAARHYPSGAVTAVPICNDNACSRITLVDVTSLSHGIPFDQISGNFSAPIAV